MDFDGPFRIECPWCGEIFKDTYALPEQLDIRDSESISDLTHGDCPGCGMAVKLTALSIGMDGIWRVV